MMASLEIGTEAQVKAPLAATGREGPARGTEPPAPKSDPAIIAAMAANLAAQMFWPETKRNR